jgi:CheY-like chemotaxis protein
MPTVLIVDDEQHIRLLIEQTLEELEDDGVDLLTAADGAEAMVVMANQHPDLVFLDVMMPKANGYEVCRAIRADPGDGGCDRDLANRQGPGPMTGREGLAAGADQYLTKPFDPDDLLRRARVALGLAGGDGGRGGDGTRSGRRAAGSDGGA